MTFSGNNMDVVLFAADLLVRLGRNCPSITITTRGSSADASASIVIDTSSEDIVLEEAKNFFLTRTDI